MLRLLDRVPVGSGVHRSGWPYVTSHLQRYATPDGILLDDFVEKTFLYERGSQLVHTEPWVGIFHHPPDFPSWYAPKTTWEKLFRDGRFRQSLPNLKLAIGLSPDLAEFLGKTLEVPALTLYHPTGLPMLYWSEQPYRAQPTLMQVGWFLRNTWAIDQVAAPGFRRVRVIPDNNWDEGMRRLVQSFWHRRPLFPGTVEWGKLDAYGYDIALAKSVVLIELLAAAANNTVIECIIRQTPIVVNRLPGPEFYLGRDYPLFYDRFEDIGGLLTEERIIEAHRYLTKLDKWWCSGDLFCRSLVAGLQEHGLCSRSSACTGWPCW